MGTQGLLAQLTKQLVERLLGRRTEAMGASVPEYSFISDEGLSASSSLTVADTLVTWGECAPAMKE